MKQCLLWSKEKSRYRNGMSRSCQKCCLVSVEAGYGEEALKKQVEKQRRQRRRNAERDKSEMKLLKKWLRASRKRQGTGRCQADHKKEQLGNV